jgi:hypothetical protein
MSPWLALIFPYLYPMALVYKTSQSWLALSGCKYTNFLSAEAVNLRIGY